MKPTNLLSNMPAVSVVMGVGCDGSHRHVRLEGGGRCRAAQRYPQLLCNTIIDAVKMQQGVGCRQSLSTGKFYQIVPQRVDGVIVARGEGTKR